MFALHGGWNGRGPHAQRILALREFVCHPGRVLSRDYLLDALVGKRAGPFDLHHLAIPILALSDNPASLAYRERIYEGLRLAGIPEG
jgi:hypothetical protein